MLIATRWMYDEDKQEMWCSHRCLTNIDALWRGIVNEFDGDWILIFGNPAALSFKEQYNLMRNVDILVSVHGAIFAWSLIFESHKRNQKMFEISIPDAPLHSEHWARMLGLREDQYHEYHCEDCCAERMENWSLCDRSRINVTRVLSDLRTFLSTPALANFR